MQLIRQGFDGLDISFPLMISEDLANEMRKQKEFSEKKGGEGGALFVNHLMVLVASTGARGGYAYRCETESTGPFGEHWFFKHPNGVGDKWGVRVSCNALPLALDGLARVRERIEERLADFGLKYEVGTESISRVDFAFDFLAPGLAPDRRHFVCHSNSQIKENIEFDMSTNGRSSRVETITVGKNPGRQVVLYDKRAEIIAKKKLYWLSIWNEARDQQCEPPLDITDRRSSEVWRLEIRAYKQHLNERWSVKTWASLRDNLPLILRSALEQVRFTTPTTDSNRNRWPDHPLWIMAREALVADMEDLDSMADQDVIHALIREERDEMLTAQIKGCMLSRAALNGVPNERVEGYLLGSVARMVRDMKRDPTKMQEKLNAARLKYSG